MIHRSFSEHSRRYTIQEPVREARGRAIGLFRLRSYRMMGRGGVRCPMILNPARLNVDTYPVPVELGDKVASSG